jgi:hypothetical protein
MWWEAFLVKDKSIFDAIGGIIFGYVMLAVTLMFLLASQIYEFHDNGVLIQKPWYFYKQRFYSFRYLDHMTFVYGKGSSEVSMIKFSFYRHRMKQCYVSPKDILPKDLYEMINYYRTHYPDKCMNSEHTPTKELLIGFRYIIVSLFS